MNKNYNDYNQPYSNPRQSERQNQGGNFPQQQGRGNHYSAPYENSNNPYYKEGSPSGRMTGKGPDHDERSRYRGEHRDYNPNIYNDQQREREYWERNRNMNYPDNAPSRPAKNHEDRFNPRSSWGGDARYDNSSSYDNNDMMPDPHYKRPHGFTTFSPDGGFGYSSGGYGPHYAQSGNQYMSHEEIEYNRAHSHHQNHPGNSNSHPNSPSSYDNDMIPDPHYRRPHGFTTFTPDGGFGYSSGGYGPHYAQSGRPYMSREEIEYERAHPRKNNNGPAHRR